MRSEVALVVIMVVAVAFSGCTEDDGAGGGRERGAVGDYNHDYLSNERYETLEIEIDFVDGFNPTTSAIQTLKDRIGTYCQKSSVSVKQDPFDSGDTSYTLEEVQALESENRKGWRSGSTIVLHILYLNGEYEDDANVLGIAYHADSFAIFKERIDDVATTDIENPLLVSGADIERSVLVHEFGHLLGLVNINYESEVDHEDPDHPDHCDHEDCVMNAVLETSEIANFVNGLSTKPPTDFESDCVDDLRALRNN